MMRVEVEKVHKVLADEVMLALTRLPYCKYHVSDLVVG